jgi:hypothetical protein
VRRRVAQAAVAGTRALPELHIPARAWQVEQQQVDARPVNDAARIALDRARVAVIVVDTMPVERQRGMAGQQDVVRGPPRSAAYLPPGPRRAT